MIVRELLVKLGFQLNNAQVNNAERATQRLKNQADQAAQSFRNIVSGLFAIQSVRGLIAVGDEMQSLRSQIGLLVQPTGTAGETLDLLVDKANAARQSIANYGSFFVKAGNATKDFITSQDELLRIVDGAAIGIAASGANAVNQAQAFYQLGQAIGSPVVQMEEMNTLIDAAPDLFRELGNVIPGANGNLKKFIGTGQVTGKMLAEGLQKVADIFEERMLKMPMTVGQATIIVGNKFSRMIDRMNRESMFITKIANFIMQSFDSIERGVDSLVKSFDGWDNTLRFIGATLLAATGVLIGFSSASIAAIAPWLFIAAAIGLAAIVIEDLMVAAEGGESVILGFVTWLQSGTAGAAALGLALTALGGVFTVWGAIASAKYIQVALAATMAGLSAIKAGAMMAAGWLAGMWPIALVIAAIAGIGYAGYKIVENWTEIKAWFSETFDWFMEKFKALSNFVSGIFGGNGFGNITGNAAFNVTPQTMAASGGKTVVSNNTNTVNIQVPAGTPQDQAAFVQNQTQKYLDSINKPITTRDAMAYGN